MAFDFTAGLLGLAQIVQKLKELTEWEKLERQEARLDLPPSFRLSNHVEEELRIRHAAFISTAMSLHEALANPAPTTSLEQRERWQRRLRQVEREVQVLGLTERFISA
jgi:hypothetical protein